MSHHLEEDNYPPWPVKEGLGGLPEDQSFRSSNRLRRSEDQEACYSSIEDKYDLGCCCAIDGCPWQWGSNEGRAFGPGSIDGSHSSSGSSSDTLWPGVVEPSSLHGPLLSVKEHRDRRTGDVRFSVFLDERRSSVAQILFRLKPRGERWYGHVTCVQVNRDFRGMGLGPLLFKEVFALLGDLSVPEVRLEAEEDVCKHNRLVRYYENLGFRRLEGAKINYIHSNDQVFRKIPMRRPLRPDHPRLRRFRRLVGNGSFLIVRLQTKTGFFLRSTADGNIVLPKAIDRSGGAGFGRQENSADGRSEREKASAANTPGEGGTSAEGDPTSGVKSSGGGYVDDHWILLLQQVVGIVCFESAYGKYLCVEPDGKVVADRAWDSSWEQFRLERFNNPEKVVQSKTPVCEEKVAQGVGDGCDSVDEDNGYQAFQAKGEASGGTVGAAKARNRFALRTYHGQYLSLDDECGSVSISAQPVLWTTDERNAICHCEGTVPWAAPPPASRRQIALEAHLRRMRHQQNVSFVTGVRQKYLRSFGSRGVFTVKGALNVLDRHSDPLVPAWVSRVSLAGLMVLTAEDIRDEGLPEWMQVIGLVHGLGRILHFLSEEVDVSPIERECVLGEYSWVVGAPFPDSITCPSYNAGNTDALDERYGAGGLKATGMYTPASGLEDALLCFTGPEYMYMLLRTNGINIPAEGLAMLRYFPLEPWHAGTAYTELETPVDREMKEKVHRFDVIRRATLNSVTYNHRKVDLQRSWDEHLSDLVDKFFPGELSW